MPTLWISTRTADNPGCPHGAWRSVTVLQFRENLSDRQAAEAVRARIDWKYLLGLELTDPGFDYSVLSEFRARVSTGAASERLLEKLLTHCQAQGLLRAGGRQRTDATHVLAAVRVLNRLELVAETLRAALNAVAAAEPAWLTRHVPGGWYQRYSRRIEYSRRPSSETERQTKTRMIGEDGMRFLAWLDEPDVRPTSGSCRKCTRCEGCGSGIIDASPRVTDDSRGTVRFTTKAELADHHDPLETPV